MTCTVAYMCDKRRMRTVLRHALTSCASVARLSAAGSAAKAAQISRPAAVTFVRRTPLPPHVQMSHAREQAGGDSPKCLRMEDIMSSTLMQCLHEGQHCMKSGSTREGRACGHDVWTPRNVQCSKVTPCSDAGRNQPNQGWLHAESTSAESPLVTHKDSDVPGAVPAHLPRIAWRQVLHKEA